MTHPVPAAPSRSIGLMENFRDRWRDRGGTPAALAELIKADLKRKFSLGDRPTVAAYLDAFPELREHSDRVLSLVYEEFCLLEEAGESPNPDSFCDRYAPWRDSLASQLNYHCVLSQACGGLPRAPIRFPEPGEDFLRFRLGRILGQGGAARVFLAEEEDLGGRQTALKISSDRGEEAAIMGKLKHPHIMQVLTVVRDHETGLRGLNMPYLPGRPLDQVLLRMAAVPVASRTAATLVEAGAPEEAPAAGEPAWLGLPARASYIAACSWIAAALADALAHAHGQGILHRDVKPANVLMTPDVGPQLLDFNLAHDPHAADRAESALLGGTLPYMAPEQLEAFRDPERWGDVGPSADLYALGLVLRELLTGERPEAPPADVPLPRAINELLDLRRDGWRPARASNPAVPHALDAILRRCLAFEAADRYPSASALADDLRAFLRRRPLAHAENPDRRERAANWLHRNRLGLVVGSLVALAAAGALALREGPADSDNYVTKGTFLHQKANSGVFSEERVKEFRRRAKECYHIALRLDPTNPRAYHGLAVIACDEGDLETNERMLDRAIEACEAAMRRPLPAHASGDTGELRAFSAHLHLQKINNATAPYHDQKQVRTAATLPLVEKMKGVLPNAEIALRDCKGAPLAKRIEIHLAVASLYSLLFIEVTDSRYWDAFEAIEDRILEQLEAEDPDLSLLNERLVLSNLRRETAGHRQKILASSE